MNIIIITIIIGGGVVVAIIVIIIFIFFPEVLHSTQGLRNYVENNSYSGITSLIPTEILKCAPKSLSIILLSADGKALEKVVSLRWLIGNSRNMAANLTALLSLLLLLLLCLKTQ